MKKQMRRLLGVLGVVASGLLHAAEAPIQIGLDADLSSGSARSGESIRRGAELAIGEINASGGVLGRPLQLVTRDHRGNPARGIDNIHEFAEMDALVAVLGGLHTPVAMKELKAIHQYRLPFLIPWAAGTPVVENGFNPNYVFRVSVRDQYAGGFLVQQAVSKGHKRIGLLLERTGWGRSNQKAMTAALAEQQLEPTVTEWFHWGETNFVAILEKMKSQGVEAVLLVANAPEGKAVVNEMASMKPSERMPILSHWGVTGGDFHQEVGHLLEDEVDLQFLQTYSFLAPHNPALSARVAARYCEQFGCDAGGDPAKAIFAPTGTAHAYDLIHLLAKGLKRAGRVDRVALQRALEQIPSHHGLVRVYQPPFTDQLHDALFVEDFRMARYDRDGTIIPQQ